MLTLSFYDLHFWKFQSAKIAQYFYGGVKMQQPQLTITRKVSSRQAVSAASTAPTALMASFPASQYLKLKSLLDVEKGIKV